MRAFILLLAYFAYFGECLGNCICRENTCICKWSGISEGDKVCLLSADTTDCIVVTSTDFSDNGSPDVGCSCSPDECRCRWEAVTADSRLCLGTAGGMRCSPVQMGGPSAFRTKRFTAGPECTCKRRKCSCELQKTMDTTEICLGANVRGNCVPIREVKGVWTSISYDGAGACKCRGDKCSCLWTRVKLRDEICLISYENVSCKPLKKRKRFARFLYYDDYCSCSDTGCSCVFSRAAARSGEMCLESSRGRNCIPVLDSTSSSDGISERISPFNSSGCYCEDVNCFCSWSDVEDGNRICFNESDVTHCTYAFRRPGDKAYVGGVSCSCDGGVCSCDWPQRDGMLTSRNAKVCHKTSSGEECLRVGTSAPENAGDELGCTCDKKRCSCKIKNVQDGDELCLKTYNKDFCGEARVLGVNKSKMMMDAGPADGVFRRHGSPGTGQEYGLH